MISTIETCGKVLLDTINHVLDFAKINTLTRRLKERPRRKSGRAGDSTLTDTRTAADPSGNADVDLALITEEVVETVFAGHDFRKRSNGPLDADHAGDIAARSSTLVFKNKVEQLHNPTSDITVIIDIEKANDWVFRSQPGAWRRILMNLFGNALKYCDQGFIKVSLRANPIPDTNTAKITLKVTDSGRGMSKQYLRERLFQPFVQEDPLSPGTGLGLSIIRAIINSMGGQIDVQSEKGSGTEVIVSCVLDHADSNSGMVEHSQPFKNVLLRTQGLSAAFVKWDNGFNTLGLSPKEQYGASLVAPSLQQLCSTWFGMKAFAATSSDLGAADIVFVPEQAVEKVLSYSKELGSKPLVVVCRNTTPTKHGLKPLSNHETVVEYITQPCGPRKMAQAHARAYDSHPTTTSSVFSLELSSRRS